MKKLTRLLFEDDEKADAEGGDEKKSLPPELMSRDSSLDAKIDGVLLKSAQMADGSTTPEENLEYVIASNIANLIKNYNNLVSPEKVILNRALNWVKKNHGDVADYVEEILLTDFNISTKTPAEAESEINASVPAAAGAGVDAGGGGG